MGGEEQGDQPLGLPLLLQLPGEAREHLSCTLDWLCGQFGPHEGAIGRVGGEEQGNQPLGLPLLLQVA